MQRVFKGTLIRKVLTGRKGIFRLPSPREVGPTQALATVFGVLDVKDGRPVKPNEPVFMQGHSHFTENVGGTACHIILVELK